MLYNEASGQGSNGGAWMTQEKIYVEVDKVGKENTLTLANYQLSKRSVIIATCIAPWENIG